MKNKTKKMIVVSFDGLSTLDFEHIKKLPNFKKFLHNSSYCKNVYTIYPSLTYPAHATIVTGKYPKNHGIINNTLLQPNRISPDWYWQRKYINGDTLFDKAIDKGLKVAALLWPVTAKSKIQYNMPEIFANRPWENQILVSLINGSPLYQLGLNFKYGKIRDGILQPQLDDFTLECLLDTLKNKNPDLTLVHFTDLDTKRHYNGFNSREAKEAIIRHDKRLGRIVKLLKDEGVYDDSTIILLGDHSSLDQSKIINLNVTFKKYGLINTNEKGQIISWQALLKNCDGSAYVYINNNNRNIKEKVRYIIDEFNKKYNCIEEVFDSDEATSLGADPKCTYMLEARKGYYFLDNHSGNEIKEIKIEEVGNVPHITINTHGYIPFKENYTTVFIAKGKGIKQGVVIDKMSLVDEGPTLAKLLGFSLEDADGKVLKEILK